MDDLIRRQDAVEFIKNIMPTKEGFLERRDVFDELGHVPSVEKKGKWINCVSSEHWKCSCCGVRASYWFSEENSSEWDKDMSEWLSDYCPNCGADMRGEEDD